MKKAVLLLGLLLGGCSVAHRPQLHTLPPPGKHFPVQVKKSAKIVQPALPIPAPTHLTFKQRWGTFKHHHPRWFR